MADDMITSLLKHYGEPVTRDSYLKLKYAGKPPASLGPEEEAELPKDDVRFMPFRPTTHEEVKAEEDAKAAKEAEKKTKKKK